MTIDENKTGRWWLLFKLTVALICSGLTIISLASLLFSKLDLGFVLKFSSGFIAVYFLPRVFWRDFVKLIFFFGGAYGVVLVLRIFIEAQDVQLNLKIISQVLLSITYLIIFWALARRAKAVKYEDFM